MAFIININEIYMIHKLDSSKYLFCIAHIGKDNKVHYTCDTFSFPTMDLDPAARNFKRLIKSARQRAVMKATGKDEL